VLTDFISNEKEKIHELGCKKPIQHSSAEQTPPVVRSFLQAHAQLPKRTAADAVPSGNDTKILHIKKKDAEQSLEDYWRSKIEEMELQATVLQDELMQQQQLVLESQSRVQTLDEVLQKRTIEYEQLLQQNADEIARMKFDHDSQLQQASQAFAQQVEASQRLLQMKNESDLAIQAEAVRLETLRQQLDEYRQQLEEEHENLQAQHNTVQMHQSTVEIALSAIANQQANMQLQYSQVNADREAAKIRWQQNQVILFVMPENFRRHA
jgi:chromosome segregation ATPase